MSDGAGVTENATLAAGELSQCLMTLNAAFGESILGGRLNEAAWRLSQAGFSKNHRKNFLDHLKTLDYPETQFLEKMAHRGFAVEQIIMFVDAPEVATTFADRTRSQIMKEVQAEWKKVPLSKRLEKGVATKHKPIGSLITLAGVTSGSLILAYGISAQDADFKEVARIAANAFTGTTANLIDAVSRVATADNVLPTLATTGITIGIGKFGKSLIEKRQVAEKARKVSLAPNLKDSIAPGALADLFSGHAAIQAKLDKIPLAHRNLLTHLSGDDIRLFLHGNDNLRAEILTARPPSYEQRLACTYAADKHLFKRWIDEQLLVGTAWDDGNSNIPATLQRSIEAMRGRSAEAIDTAPRTQAIAGLR